MKQQSAALVSGVCRCYERVHRVGWREHRLADRVFTSLGRATQRLSDQGARLEPAFRRRMESQFSHPLGGVRVHTDSEANGLTRLLRAQAFTIGEHIFFGAEQYQPSTHQGVRLLAHELTHVVQQTRNTGAALSTTEEAELEAMQSEDVILDGHSFHPHARIAIGVSMQMGGSRRY